MYIIVGLGNPTKTYDGTRHNIGFAVIDQLAADCGICVDEKKHKAKIGRGHIGGKKIILAKPQTYMNLSGESVRALIDYYKVSEDELIIIYDDTSLDIGQIRIRGKGSAGGHNGIKSIISHLGTMEFPRIKVGIGNKPQGWDLADYVLSKFKEEEKDIMEEAVKSADNAIRLIITEGINEAMNRYNVRKKHGNGEEGEVK